jgi:hypothetical protein
MKEITMNKTLLALLLPLTIVIGCTADPSIQYPAGTVFCHTKNDCKKHQYCGFTQPSSYAVCLDKTTYKD